ncbi:MAG: enoyl-CoA hydratase/isomerase family protein [Chloroflexi bacterium]|nr:enoyl-CoA hydratase/isomerase family protein [Chloroflexota bacterium]
MTEVEYVVEGAVARIVINRPERMNAMTDAMYEAVSEGFRAAEADRDVRAVIVSGAGGRAFSAGHDLNELGGDRERGAWTPYRPRRWDNGMECAKPTIAAIDGYCLAGGLELALFCDIRIASDRSQFGAPEVKWNVLHGYGALRLPDFIGMSNTLQLVLSGEFIDAAAALRTGLVSEVLPPDDVMPRAQALAARIAANGPAATRLIKELVYRGRDLPLAEGLRLYREYTRIAAATEDAHEGPRAFVEKRMPTFHDR